MGDKCMKVKNKKIFIAILLTICCLILSLAYPLASLYENKTYEKYAGAMIYLRKEVFVKYDSKSIDISKFDTSALVAHLQCQKRDLYFKNSFSDNRSIIISIPNKITLKIIPLDNDSVILNFDMQFGWDRNYILNGSNFDDFLDILFEITDDEMFMKTGDGVLCPEKIS